MQPNNQNKTLRPTRKQRQMLQFIEDFIARHGYSPSYREIMRGMGYGSVSTVAKHIDNLIVRGHLDKRDFEARSLEVKNARKEFRSKSQVKEADEKWLVRRVEAFISELELEGVSRADKINDAYILLAALEVLGMTAASQKFAKRLSALES